MNRDEDEQFTEDVALEASRWLLNLERSEVYAEIAFYQWLCAHPSHLREFLDMTWLDIELERLEYTDLRWTVTRLR